MRASFRECPRWVQLPIVMDYRCPRCARDLPRGDVYLRPNGKILRCKECQRSVDRAYYAANPERRRKQKRDARRRELLGVYGLTVEQYDKLVREAGGVCPSCSRERPLQVDHDHSSGVVRGMLCPECNKILGLARDEAATLEWLASYLDVNRGVE